MAADAGLGVNIPDLVASGANCPHWISESKCTNDLITGDNRSREYNAGGCEACPDQASLEVQDILRPSLCHRLQHKDKLMEEVST